MPSMFYQKIDRLFDIPMVCFEHILLSLKTEDSEDLQKIEQVYRQALVKYCGIKKVMGRDLEYLSERVNRFIEDQYQLREKSEDKSRPSPAKKTYYGESYSDWVSSLETWQACLLTAGFDLQKAEYLYTVADRDDAIECIALYLEKTKKDQGVQFESVVFGMGGNLDGTKSGEVVHDINTESGKNSLAMLFGSGG